MPGTGQAIPGRLLLNPVCFLKKPVFIWFVAAGDDLPKIENACSSRENLRFPAK
jgi:hypothetical protein